MTKPAWTDRFSSHTAAAAFGTLVVLAAFAVFIVRTSLQPQYRPCDFALYYTASGAWLAGADPYDVAAAPARWAEAGGRADIMPELNGARLQWMPIILLPPTLPLFAPLALLPATVAVWTWYALAAMLLVAQTAALADLIGSRLWEPRGMLLLAITLVLAPLHEAFGYAQPSGPTISLMILGAWAAVRRYDVTAGVLIGLATALKPQMGGVLLLFYLVLGRWRLVGTCAAVGLLLGVIALVPMTMRGTPWLAGWQSNMAEVDRIGGYNSPFPENPMRRQMLNLQMILGGVLDNFALVNLLAIALTGLLAVALVVAVRRARSRGQAPDELLLLSAVCVLGLLPVYHRFYDATLLVVPIAWALGNLKRRPLDASLVLAFALSFMLPVPVTTRAMQVLGIDADRASGLWWDFLLEPWRVWVLLAGLLILCRAIVRPAVESAGASEWSGTPDRDAVVGTPQSTTELATT